MSDYFHESVESKPKPKNDGNQFSRAEPLLIRPPFLGLGPGSSESKPLPLYEHAYIDIHIYIYIYTQLPP